jgi:hypothetical protein
MGNHLGGQSGDKGITSDLMIGLLPTPSILQNDSAPMLIDKPPFLDLIEGSKASEANQIIVQAAIPYARGLNSVVDICHLYRTRGEALDCITPVNWNPGDPSQRRSLLAGVRRTLRSRRRRRHAQRAGRG